MRDITLADTFYHFFTTRAFATGIPTVLAGTPVVSIYENDSATEITAGITLGVDHDSRVGLNLLTIVATGANGYEAGKDYTIVITTGTVDSVSVVGEVVGQFSIGRSAAAVDLANGTDGLGTIKTETAAIVLDTAEIGTAGVGLTDLGGMSTGMKGEVNAQADTALTDYDAPTEAEMNARTIVSANYFDPVADTVANVTTVGTTTTNTDMRGTDSAFLAANAPTNFSDLAITVTTGLVKLAAVTHTGAVIPTVTTLTGHTAQTGDSFARIGAAGVSLTDLGGISTAGLDALADAILDRTDGVEPGSGGTERTVREALRIILAAAAGKLSGAASTTVSIRDTNDAKNRIVATVDANGNRSAVTLIDT